MVQKKRYSREYIAIVAVFFLILGITLLWCQRKSDLFIDEIATYGLSNSYYAPFVQYIPEDDSLINKVLTQKEIKDYLTVSSTDAFCYDSVYYNQTQDTQPPLYYMLLHTLCSVFQGSYSKWIGLSMNLILQFGVLIVLYQIGKMILKSKMYSIAAVLIYGLSYGGLSNVLMIRMYILLTFLTVCFAFVLIKLFQEEIRHTYYLAVCLLLFLGLFTQYFFVIFAFFLSVVYCLKELKNKNFKRVFKYALFAFTGIFIFYFSYPCVLDQLFADRLVSANTAAENMMDIAGMLLSIYSFIMQILASYKPILLLVIIAFLTCLFSKGKMLRSYISNFDVRDYSGIAMMVALICTVLTVAVVSPVTALRYVYNILPLIAVIIMYFVKLFIGESRITENTVIVFCFIICFVNGLHTIPEYVESVPEENFEILKEYEKLPCIYMDDVYSAINQDMLELIRFKEIYVTDDIISNQTLEYLQQQDTSKGLVLYVDVSSYWGSGYDANMILEQLLENTSFENFERLFTYSFSETYHVY